MNGNVVAFGFLFLFFRLGNSEPGNEPASNGHIPDYDPEFMPRHVFAVHLRLGVPFSKDYGPIPSNNVNERNRIVNLLSNDVSANSAGTVRVYDVYETNNLAMRTTINGFLCGREGVYLLLRKTGDSKYEKIKYDHMLSDFHVNLWRRNNQQK